MKKPLMLAFAALALSAFAAPSFAADWWTSMPATVTGKTKVNVRNYGALGNGVHDDTAAFQAAVNALPADGGTVYVPAGRFMINALKPIKMRSHTRLLMDSLTTLEVIPNSATRYFAIKVENVTDVRIVGGNLVGDRAKHVGTTGEWGFGIYVTGAKNVVIKQVNLSNFWGDGIWIGAIGKGTSLNRSDYVTVDRVVSSNNRRQGLSIGPAQHVLITDSTFQNTNGTLPEAGIDIEPQDQGPANTIRLQNNTFANNHGNGIEMHTNISDITITGNKMIGNYGYGVLGISAAYINVTGNTMTQNGLAGVRPSAVSHHWSITGNTLQYNSTRYMSATSTGGQLNRDLQFSAKSYAISVSNNIYSNAKYNGYVQ
ncbi:glycosyl hydrolase family 28-related protein [Frateuria sp. YIM B11624]|uniref:glycosyl hydrolase family 28-related protein n=1 Tax=Frateuria sp. YIM B11624 TaxID=3143185 RepID=UPI003C7103A4